MKHLLLMRHAKSSWGDDSLPDFERPLNNRGENDALNIGIALRDRHAVPDLIICSSAVRARQTTARLLSRPEGLEGTEVQVEHELYGADARTILRHVQAVSDKIHRLLVVAHNPGMEQLVELMTGEWPPQGMKTAAVASITVESDDWISVEFGELNWVLYPGDL